MGLRLSNMFLLVLVAVTTSLITFEQATGAETGLWQGTVTMCSGNVTLQRGDQVLRIVRGGGLQSGDRINSGEEANVALVLADGPVIILDAATTVAIAQSGKQWQVNIEQGEARLIHNGDTDLIVTTGNVDLDIGRAIVQVEKASGETRFEVVQGSAIVQAANQRPFTATSGNILAADSSGTFRKASAADWDLEPGKIRLAAAMQTSPQLNLPQPVVVDPNVDASGNPTGSPSDTSVGDTELQPFEDEEDSRIVQTTPTTRGDVQDPMAADASPNNLISTFAGSSSLSLGSLSSAGTGAFSTGAANTDALNRTDNGQVGVNSDPRFTQGSEFNGEFSLVTAETRYPFEPVRLTPDEFDQLFPSGRIPNKYFSLVKGKPTGQFVYDDGINPVLDPGAQPVVLPVPGFGVSVIQYDYNNQAEALFKGVTYPAGFVLAPGTPTDPPEPPAPPTFFTFVTINNPNGDPGFTPTDATNKILDAFASPDPVLDDRAKLNQAATFVLGEFMVTSEGTDGISFSVRRSDQDRLHTGFDPAFAGQPITPNPDVEFQEEKVGPNDLFFTENTVIQTPTSLDPRGTSVSELNRMRKAAFTTIVADQLQDYSRRTGQTRFVVDGQIIDISGYPGR